jgi:hypothetical protein
LNRNVRWLMVVLLGCAGEENKEPTSRKDTGAETSETSPTSTSTGSSSTGSSSTSSTSSTSTSTSTSSTSTWEGPRSLVISEIMPKNRSSFLDEDGHASDWIEIQNLGDTPYDLTGVGLGDPEEPWVFPVGELGPGELLMVFASRKDRRDGELHTDFALSASGESLWLTAADGTTLDAFDPYPEVDTSVTYGRAGFVLVESGEPYRWRVPEDATTAWTSLDFEDLDWADGAGGLGQEGEGDSGPLAHLGPSLASYWTFDDADGSVVPDHGGTHPGWLEAGASVTTGGAGWSGEALSGDTGGWLAAESPETYDFDDDHTWSLWFRGRDASGCLISRNPSGTDWNQGSKALFVRDRTLQYDSGWVGNPGTGVTVTDNVWHHVAVTFEADDDTFKIYLDGTVHYDARFDTNAFPEDTVHNGGQARTGLFVGEANFSGGLDDLGKYQGQIDEVAIFSEALSEDDVLLLAAGETPSGSSFGGAIDTWVPEGSTRAQLRLPFEVDDPEAFTSVNLEVRYDDGVLIWLNGVQVGELNAEKGALAATAERDDALALSTTTIGLPIDLLQPGTNVLAAEVLAAEGDDPTLFLDLSLSASTSTLGVLAEESPGRPNGPFMSSAVIFSTASTTFVGDVVTELTTDDGLGAIRYTLDGSQPHEGSAEYTGPLTIEETTELRARTWQDGLGAGPVGNAIYVETDPTLRSTARDLPVLVLIASSIDWGWTDAPLLAFDPEEEGTLADPPSYAGPSGVHIRGQSSAYQDKTPYRLELRDAQGHDDDHPLLGLPEAADWVLHAPYVDKSLMRNALIFELGREMGIAAPRTRYAHLYVVGEGDELTNGHYEGVYVLMETVEISSERLDLQDLGPEVESGTDLSGGYVLKFEADVAESPILSGWGTLELHEPDPVTSPQLDWITDHVNDFDDMLFGSGFDDPVTGYASWIDVDSWVNHLLINELSRDQDAYVRSAYFHKDREGPLVMGPLWDYNLIAGTGGYFDNTEIEGWQWQHSYNVGESGWHERIMEDPLFAAQVQARWNTLREGLLSDDAMAARIETHALELAHGATDNFERWDNLRDDSVNGFVSPSTLTWEGQIEFLTRWLSDRSAWIDAQLD